VCENGDKCEELQGSIFSECNRRMNASHFIKACQDDAKILGDVSQRESHF